MTHPEIERTARIMRSAIKAEQMAATFAFNSRNDIWKEAAKMAKEGAMTATGNWLTALDEYTPRHKVIYVPTFEGTNGLLAHAAIVEVQTEGLENDEHVKGILLAKAHREIEVLTPGAVKYRIAMRIANAHADAEKLKVYVVD